MELPEYEMDIDKANELVAKYAKSSKEWCDKAMEGANHRRELQQLLSQSQERCTLLEQLAAILLTSLETYGSHPILEKQAKQLLTK